MSRRPSPDSRPVSVAVLGTDAVLAALPASAVQLSHACRTLGYDMVFPASWGDELVAQSCLRRLGDRPGEPAILCACPRVADRLTRAGRELEPLMISLPAPPVAAARNLRMAFGDRTVHITYVGECPAATDPSIDAQIDPAVLLAQFAERDIVPAEQPQFFESVLPPDRRRHFSLPGGVPSAECVAIGDPRRALVELDGADYLVDLAQRLLSRQNALIDLALPAGCACAGATRGARATLIALEPPRAPTPILDVAIDPTAIAPPPSPQTDAAPPDGPTRAAGLAEAPRPEIRLRSSPAVPMVRPRAGSAVPRAFAVQRAFAARRERPVTALPPATFSTRPRSRPAPLEPLAQPARGTIIPLSTEPAYLVSPPPPPPPTKLRPNPSLGATVPLAPA